MTDHPLDIHPTTIPDEMMEAIAAHALESLPPEEEAKVATYLERHPEARTLLDEYRAVVDLLPYAAVPSEPPPALKEGVLRSIRDERPRRRFAFPVFRFRFAPVIAACVLLGMLVWNVGLQLRVGDNPTATATTTIVDNTSEALKVFLSTPGLVSYEMRPEAAAPNAWGRIYLTQDRSKAGFAVSKLPVLPPDKTYQLWFRLDDQTRVGVTTFSVDATGAAVMVLSVPPSAHTYISCGITQEPKGGSRIPTGPRVLASQEWPTGQSYP